MTRGASARAARAHPSASPTRSSRLYPPDAWLQAAAAAFVPRPRLTVSEWADRFRVIDPSTSPEPGPWSTARVPYLRAIMDAVNDLGVEVVVVMIASQLGKSEAILNILGFFVHQEPSPILFVQPTVDAMEHFSKERIEPSFRATPVLRDKLDTGQDGRGHSRKKSETIRLKTFPGGYLAMEGSNAPSGLASRPILVVLFDEVDRFKASAGDEGNPVKIARRRTNNFHNRKIVLVSTPGTEGASSIQKEYNQGDRCQFLVPCPHCGHRQLLIWERLRFRDAAGNPDLAHVHYPCANPACGRPIEERHKEAMLAAGEWVPQVPGGKQGTGRVRSFGDLSALYSPWVHWAELAEQWLEAEASRDPEDMKVFVNTALGRPYADREHVVAPEHLARRRSTYGPTLPADVVLLTAGVDTQNDRLEAEVVAWGRGRESWGVEYHRLAGDPATAAPWRQLDELLARTWRTEDGRTLKVSCACVDSAGQRTSHVYAYCRARERRNVRAVIGRGGDDRVIVGEAKRTGPQRVGLITVGVDVVKSTLMDRLALEADGPGYCHVPCGPKREAVRGYDQAWVEGILSERRMKVLHEGRETWRWVPVGPRNEALDCRVYATAALEILAPNLERLAERVGGGARRPVVGVAKVKAKGSPVASGQAHGQQAHRHVGRRVLSRGVV